MSIFEVLDRVKPTLPVAPVREQARVLVSESRDRTLFTVPVQEASLHAEDFLTRLDGRLVGAETPNANGQLWLADDLEVGLPSVAGGPLNWLHQERTIVGALTDAAFVTGRQAAADAPARSPYIRAGSVVWSYLYPAETAAIRAAAAAGQLYYSMECISRTVECAGTNGCGARMAYADALRRTEAACTHIRDRASARRFVDPVFQGAAVIVPPVTPGWADAHVEVVRRAAAAMETTSELAAFTDGRELLAAQILSFLDPAGEADGNAR